MFVIENTVASIKSYMIDKLCDFYTEREINYFFKVFFTNFSPRVKYKCNS